MTARIYIDRVTWRQQRFGEWLNWSRGKPLPPGYRHWTPAGAVQIRPVILTGMLFAELIVGERRITTGCDPMNLAHRLHHGELDDKLGLFAMERHRVPRDPHKWNGLR